MKKIVKKHYKDINNCYNCETKPKTKLDFCGFDEDYNSPHWKMIIFCPACSRFIQRHGCNKRLVVNECIEDWNNYDGLIKINRNWTV